MRWLELSCQADREAAEAVSELFARHGRGVVVEDVDVLDGEVVADPDSPVTLRTYLPLDDSAAAKRLEIQKGLWILGMLRQVGDLTERELAEADWAEAWKAHFYVHRVGRRLVIKPSWREYEPKPGDAIVELDPGMAFGTGLHPTTRLCLQALEDLVVPGQSVLDLGTGSGILAIAAARLGARSVLALDTDPVAVDAATANVAANGLSQTVTVAAGTLPQAEPQIHYDLVVANIIARVIVELAPALAAALRPGGTLIASGVLAERGSEVAAALARARLVLAERRQSGDWLALLARR
ncbi:MAG: 50S ribosomal protein L11 methyltransferase [Chloroflexi bacterium]|nr:50S ribosomal protein L11 methyltransferase [Chloroflexota bacterium]